MKRDDGCEAAEMFYGGMCMIVCDISCSNETWDHNTRLPNVWHRMRACTQIESGGFRPRGRSHCSQSQLMQCISSS